MFFKQTSGAAAAITIQTGSCFKSIRQSQYEIPVVFV